MTHYTKEDLELFRNGQMSVLGKIGCAAHLKSCKECADLLKELESEDRLIHDLRNSLQIYKEITEKQPPCQRPRTRCDS